MTQQEREKEIVRIKFEARSEADIIKFEQGGELDNLDRETMEQLRELEARIIELNKERVPLFEDYHGNISEIKRLGILMRELEFCMKNVKTESAQKRQAIERRYGQRMRELNNKRDAKLLELLTA